VEIGTRSKPYVSGPSRPGDGTSRSWKRQLGHWLYSFTLVNMPDGEVRWFVRRYDTRVELWTTKAEETRRMRFGCYWHPYREWTFKPTN
jgi:hypothetical protein